MHPKPMRETFSPSEPRATCFIFPILTGVSRSAARNHRSSRTLGLVWNQRGLIASLILTAVLITAGGFLGFYALLRPPSQHALMNAEGIIAVSFLLILYVRSREPQPPPTGRVDGFDALNCPFAVALIAIVISLAFAGILRTPFLYDDYTHITDASGYTWGSIARQFGQTAGRGLFFRPAGFFLYWLNYLWAGPDPERWHASSIALHAGCSCLTYTLSREVGLSRLASLAGALLFGLNGVSAETVAWIDARFDLMTTFLLLLSLIFICRYVATGRRSWLAGALVTGACGMLSKESGFCLPFLVASIGLLRDRKDWNRIGMAASLTGALAIVLFAYRWWALRGIGGYANPAGDVNILRFNIVHTLNALLVRQWAIVFFPFNWSAPASLGIRAALAATPFLLAACAWMARPHRRFFVGCLLFTIAAGLPVQHLLLLSPDLGGSRQLYLGSAGAALLWAAVLDTMGFAPRVAGLCLLLVLEASVLEHNLETWRETSELAHSVCTAFGQTVAGMSGTVVVSGLPASRNGAVFLHNGFPQCVEMNSEVPADRIQVRDSGPTNFIWNDARSRIEKAN
jgi:hypothetical protein